jgi:hypothetical protein
MDSNSLINALKLICTYLNDKKIPYVIVGGISVIAWGRSRTTDDIDIILDHRLLNIEDFVTYLTLNNFFADLDDFQGFESKDHCTIFFKDGLFRIDIIGIYNQDNQTSVDNAVLIEFYNIKIKIDNPESLIAHKLVFNSDQDIEDAYAILIRLDNKIDKKLLLWYAERLNVVNRLKELLKKSKL